jgi:hypothetical protein
MADIKIALAVDSNNPTIGDLYLENGTVRLTNDLREAVAQQLFIRFRFFKGEWFLDATQGTPWLQSILGKKTPLSILSQIFKQLITTCPGVKKLTTFSISRTANRNVSVVFAAQLNNGQVLTSSDFAAYVIGGV